MLSIIYKKIIDSLIEVVNSLNGNRPKVTSTIKSPQIGDIKY
jgi:hypothetical protein